MLHPRSSNRIIRSKRFNKPNSSITGSNNRIGKIMSNIAAEIQDGNRPKAFSFFDTMQGRARLRSGKGQDNEGTTNEMLLCLPFYAILQIHHWFLELYLNPNLPHPHKWTNVDFKGIPKTRNTDRFSKLRWIAGINAY